MWVGRRIARLQPAGPQVNPETQESNGEKMKTQFSIRAILLLMCFSAVGIAAYDPWIQPIVARAVAWISPAPEPAVANTAAPPVWVRLDPDPPYICKQLNE